MEEMNYMEKVKQNGLELEYVPEDMKTPEMCLAAVRRNGYALEYVPEDIKTAEVCLATVKRYGLALEYVPMERRTAELCLVAVEQNGGALDYVPEDKLTARCKSRLRARRRRRGMRVENWNGHGIRFVDKDGEWWAVAKDGGIVLLHEPYAKTRAALPPIVNTLRSRGYDITTVGALATQKQITLKAGVCYNAL